MKTSKAIRKFVEAAKLRDSYWVEEVKLDFSMSLERQRKREGLTYKAIADAIGTSPAYVSKVFRGDANLTIETMVKLVRAAKAKLYFEVAPESDGMAWAQVIKKFQPSAANHTIQWAEARKSKATVVTPVVPWIEHARDRKVA